MWGRRFGYLAALVCSLIFFGCYKEWLSWIVLLTVILLPLISLLFSLPAMLTVKAELRCAGKVVRDMPARVTLQLKSMLPTPPVRCRVRLENSLTGQSFLGAPGERIPTEHCGAMTVSYPELSVYDYLGLFRRRLHTQSKCVLYIFPKPVPTGEIPKARTGAVELWRPKPGGGFSEMHELRLYRPGDELRQIHWKMSAKTGKLIYREPMEAVGKGYLLTMTLWGSPREVDGRLGKLFWLSKAMTDKQMPHRILCHTGNGTLEFSVTDPESLDRCMETLLSAPLAAADISPSAEKALWHRHIGGDSNEA